VQTSDLEEFAATFDDTATVHETIGDKVTATLNIAGLIYPARLCA